jgi:hypothetical protein
MLVIYHVSCIVLGLFYFVLWCLGYFCNVWVCICVGFVMRGCVCVCGVLQLCGFCNCMAILVM